MQPEPVPAYGGSGHPRCSRGGKDYGPQGAALQHDRVRELQGQSPTFPDWRINSTADAPCWSILQLVDSQVLRMSCSLRPQVIYHHVYGTSSEMYVISCRSSLGNGLSSQTQQSGMDSLWAPPSSDMRLPLCQSGPSPAQLCPIWSRLGFQLTSLQLLSALKRCPFYVFCVSSSVVQLNWTARLDFLCRLGMRHA